MSREARPNITYVGNVCIDRIIDHNQIDANNQPTITEDWGSPGFHMMDYVNQLPRRSRPHLRLFATHGKDLRPHIRRTGLKVGNRAEKGLETLVYENNLVGNDRTQRCWYAEQAYPPTLNRKIMRTLAKTDILVVAPLVPNLEPEYIEKLVQPLAESCFKLLLPQGFLRHIDEETGIVTKRIFEEADDILPLFDAAVISDEDCIDALVTAQRWAEHAPKTSIIVTENKNGATIVTSEGTTRVPTVPIDPEDMKRPPVGLGDVFSIEYSRKRHGLSTEEESVLSGHVAVGDKLLAA